jgi:DNA-binding GntR family transcriptional regulator
MAIFQKVEAKTLRPLIAGDIRNAIFDGRLQPGERLVERKLAEQFGASLTVIREALVELEIEGYIVKRQNKASHVIRVTLAEANKVFEMRGLLEPWAAAEAARHARAEDVVQLRARFREMRKHAAAKDITGYLRADRLFHEQIWRMSATIRGRRAIPLTASPHGVFLDAVQASPIRSVRRRRRPRADPGGHRRQRSGGGRRGAGGRRVPLADPPESVRRGRRDGELSGAGRKESSTWI